MTGGKNVFSYITTEGKRLDPKTTDKKRDKLTALEYLQKSTGVFNGSGMLDKEQVDEMKARLKENKGNIWHGFISLSEQDSEKIDNPEKCIALVKQNFGAFFRDCKLNENNIDLMCALHLDKPKHLHIHFVFWEKEPKYKDTSGNLTFRKKGKIEKDAIDNMFVRLGLYIDEDKDHLYKSRDNAIKELRGMTNAKRAMRASEQIKAEIISLAKDLPKSGRLSYGSKDLESYRGRIDKIVKMLLNYDGQARESNNKFYQAVDEKNIKIQNICGQKPFAFSTRNVQSEDMLDNLPKYHNKIDVNSINIMDKVVEDYKRRQGNLVLKLAKFIKPELYEKKKGKSYKPNDKNLKRNYAISAKKIGGLFNAFLSSFGAESKLLERDFNNRLHEIEEEIKDEQKKKEKEANQKG